MPYDNVPEALWDKMDECKRKVMEKQPDLDEKSAIAICYSSVVEGKACPCDDEVKVGARNNSGDRATIREIRKLSQQITDHTVSLEPDDEDKPDVQELPWGNPKALDEGVIFSGAEVKALGDGKVAGYLVRFSDPTTPDLTGDFFSKDTNLGVIGGSNIPIYYQHGFDEIIKARSIGRGVVKMDDIGLWIEAQLSMRDEYERAIYGLAEKGKLGWSSGAAGHLVEREQEGEAYRIKSWPIAEASLTPTPAEPRNSAIPIKSLLSVSQKSLEVEKGNTNMDENEMKAMLEQVAEAAVKKYAESLPPVKAGFQVEVTEDEADRAAKGNPFKTAGEFFKAVKNAALAPEYIDKRLFPLKATGLNEAIPSQGGFLVTQDIAAGISEHMWGIGTVLGRFNPLTVSGNGLIVNAIDETSRANGSRGGGVLGYWLEEGGTKTKSKPKFRQVNLKLHKVAALAYATDELLDDETALEGWLNRYVPGELTFKVEDAIINGNGIGMPLGILNSPALVTPLRVDASVISDDDVTKMWSLRYAGVNDYVWFCNQNIMPQLLAMTVGQTPVYMAPGGLSGSQYGTLLGRPVIETEYNPGLGTAGDLLLASPSQYLLITKGGVQAASSIHVAFLSDEVCFRFVYRVDGMPEWDSSVTAFNSTDTISPFVALSAST